MRCAPRGTPTGDRARHLRHRRPRPRRRVRRPARRSTFKTTTCPPKSANSAATIVRWRTQITAWHRARVTNGPTEAINNLVKRVKRVAFGFRRFAHYRIRSLLYADRPNWGLLPTITPR
ncbi:MAG: transposase [Acidimicrobiia bacterium]|nr:transposase [Acidimicrobiia bacterium]